MKFLVDMPLPPTLARWLTTQGHDAVHARDVGLDRSTDTEIIETALADNRAVITLTLITPGYSPFHTQPHQA